MVFLISRIVAVASLVLAVNAQYDRGYDGYSGGYKSSGAAYNSLGQGGYQKPIAILSHKQAQAHDGAVNYGFSSENGIHQGEVINPDGSRQGSYSYVDPNGKTVSLKYVAGKDGFHVVEGDHIPKAVPLPATHQAAHAEAFARASSPEYSSGPSYRAPSAPYKRPYHIDESEEPSHQQSYRSASYGPSANEENFHNGPHSFGPGYSFEFGGH